MLRQFLLLALRSSVIGRLCASEARPADGPAMPSYADTCVQG